MFLSISNEKKKYHNNDILSLYFASFCNKLEVIELIQNYFDINSLNNDKIKLLNPRTMNLSKQTVKKTLLYLVLLFLSPMVMEAQSLEYENHTVLKNTLYSHDFLSPAGLPYIYDQPNNGSASIGCSGNATCVLNYTPDTDFVGTDSIILIKWLSAWTTEQVGLRLQVVESIVNAVDDYATTTEGTQILIDVLANDTGSSGFLNLSAIPLENNANASIQNGKIAFKPHAGFNGTAYCNYTVCDDFGTCDMGVVTVVVVDDSPSDTIYLTTPRNQYIDVSLYLSNGYEVTQAPSHGTTSVLNEGTVRYTPANNYAGNDQFVYATNLNSSTTVTTFIVDVLDTAVPNEIAFDDLAYTTVGDEVQIDVLLNDIGLGLTNPLVTDDPNNGDIILQQGGTFTYRPDNGFVGIDKFKYRTCQMPSWDCEIAEVTVVVNNLNPSLNVFELSTAQNTPLVINYDVPVENFEFNINNHPGNGTLEYSPGQTTSVILGQVVSGNNMLIYTPSEDFVGLDEFEVEYCSDGDCKVAKVIVDVFQVDDATEASCVSNCVWAGDANNDGVVNMLDILPLGLCMGHTGEPRDNPVMDWYGQHADDWNAEFSSEPVDLKYVDTNGDGIISSSDTTAISMNYDRYHTITPEAPLNVSELLYLVYTPGQDFSDLENGDVISYDVLLGLDDPSLYATDKYGITFNMDFSPKVYNTESAVIDIDESSWFAYNSPMLNLLKVPNPGHIEVGITRTTNVAASGYGRVAQVFIVIGDVNGFKLDDESIAMRISNAYTMNGAGDFQRLNDVEIGYPIDASVYWTGVDESKLKVYPNPVGDVLNVHLNGREDRINRLSLYTITGQEVYRVEDVSSKTETIDVSRFGNGFYVLKAFTEKGMISKKVEIIH